MRYINNYFKFFESSQSKKIRKYINFSVVLKWYSENKEKIAELLNCKIDDLASEDTLLEQSYDLVKDIINSQYLGNDGIGDIVGFNNFEKIENNLIHDILHNIFMVKDKEFQKNLSNIDYSESEIVEEIEVLSIEESFMKYMNIDYPKTDFINANLNQLCSYLMMSILKNDPNRIEKILDNEIDPYLEVYGKKYLIKDTAFKNIFNLFKNRNADPYFKINNSDDLKDYIIRLINVADGIESTNGDRSQYPQGGYYGLKYWDGIDSSQKIDYINNNFSYRNTDFFVIGATDKISKLTFRYQIVDKNFNLKDKIDYYLNKFKFKDNILNNKNTKLTLDLGNILFDKEEIYVNYLNKDTNKTYNGYIKIDNIPNYVGKQLKLEYNIFLDIKNVNQIPINKNAIEHGYIDLNKWIDFLSSNYGKNIVYNIGNEKFVGLLYIDGKYTILSQEEFEEKLSDLYNDNNQESYDDDHIFINYDEYNKMTFSEVVSVLFKYPDAIAIMRRNFRANDIIKNNLNIGKLSGEETVETKNPKHSYLNFKGEYNNTSISKNILTDNGKRLLNLLNNLRGYVIKNINLIKSEYKEKNLKYKKILNTIKSFSFDTNLLKKFVDTNFNEFRIKFYYSEYSKSLTPALNWDNNGLSLDDVIEFLKKYDDFKMIAKLDDDDFDYLKNFINNGISLKKREYFNLSIKRCREIVKKHSLLKLKDSLKDFLERYNNYFDLTNDEAISLLSNTHSSDNIKAIVNKYYPNLKIKKIEVIKNNLSMIDFYVYVNV